jgi:hypothetical protein
MAEDTDTQTETPKKKGFFRRLLKWTVIAGLVAGAVAFFKRRRGQDLDDEWQELPPPSGG